MPTYQVECENCGQPKWPSLPERPASYLCVLCGQLTPEQRVKKRQAISRGLLTRKRRAKDKDARQAGSERVGEEA